jgi:hypothetical protein
MIHRVKHAATDIETKVESFLKRSYDESEKEIDYPENVYLFYFLFSLLNKIKT